MTSALLEPPHFKSMSHPANRLPPEYDEMQPQDYDPQFTADISTKMRVPDRIGISAEEQNTVLSSHEVLSDKDLRRSATMSIPDKIVMLGQEQSAGIRELPDLHLDFMSYSHKPGRESVGLETPPRVITLDERPFPALGEDTENKSYDDASFLTADDKDKSGQQLPNGYTHRTPPNQHNSDSLHYEAMMATPGEHLLIADDSEDDLTLVRRQVAKLSRHVIRLEEENAKRSQREMYMYPLMLGYILFQVAKWFLANNK